MKPYIFLAVAALIVPAGCGKPPTQTGGLSQASYRRLQRVTRFTTGLVIVSSASVVGGGYQWSVSGGQSSRVMPLLRSAIGMSSADGPIQVVATGLAIENGSVVPRRIQFGFDPDAKGRHSTRKPLRALLDSLAQGATTRARADRRTESIQTLLVRAYERSEVEIQSVEIDLGGSRSVVEKAPREVLRLLGAFTGVGVVKDSKPTGSVDVKGAYRDADGKQLVLRERFYESESIVKVDLEEKVIPVAEYVDLLRRGRIPG